MKYKVIVPPTMEQGSYSTIAEKGFLETMRQNALWHYNSARDHDGQKPLNRMPKGTQYIPINN
ncbi:MAG: hypothetical protein M0R03_08620 [Novosphingobium sp.]|nr:hypothetical protein [Novosphingobium sp.]